MTPTLLAGLLLAGLQNPPTSQDGRPIATLALVVASNRGTRSERAPLQYADDDGAKYHHVFAAIAGEERTVLLTEFDRDTARLFPELQGRTGAPTRAAVIAAGEAMARRAARLRAGGNAVRFYFVFAGHGDVDEGKGFIELADAPFTSDDVYELLERVGAAETHVILDSCNAFFVVSPRKPGGRRVLTPRDAAEVLARRLPGVGVFLSTSSQAEVYEWSELQSGVFSHAVRSGLLGAADADGDDRVTYQELAGFVETASSEIKNPLYRPRVFARGPDGDAARAIAERPASARTSLQVDGARGVRFAIRDEDGLRWVDGHTEDGAGVRVWLPSSRGVHEVERLERVPGGVFERTATYRLPPPPAGAAAYALAALDPVPVRVVERGAGEIFRSLFTQPFGARALDSFLSGGGLVRMVELPPDPEPRDDGLALGGRPLRLSARAGMALPKVRVSGTSVESPSFTAGSDLAVAAALPLRNALGLELEVGWIKTQSSEPYRSAELWDAVLGPGYVGDREPPAVDVALEVVPITLNLELAWRLSRTFTSSLSAGAGAAWQSVEFRPVDLFTDAVQHVQGWSPTVQAGAGLSADLGGGVAAGLRGEVLALVSPLRAYEADIGFRAYRLALTVAWAPSGPRGIR